MRRTDGRVRGGALALSVLLAGGLASCRPQRPAVGRPASPAEGFRFTEVTAAAGLRFRHTHGGFGKKLMPETVGSGCAWLDYDGDGHTDLLLVNCSPLPGGPLSGDKPARSTCALYHNRGDGTFEDRTSGSGLDVPLYGQGVAVADYDNDGDPDVFLTALGRNHLFRNDGSGHFTDVTRASGLGEETQPWRWHTGAAWLDYDRDGRLDLFVARYVRWTPETDQFCGVPGGLKRYCPPWKYPGERCALYRNLGNGRFQDVSRATGVDQIEGKWFQPLVVDENADGWPDVVVVSDGTPAALFRNQAGKRFVDAAAETGLGLSENGIAKSQMGVDAADWRNQGSEAILVGNFSGQRLSFYDPLQPQLFTDVADRVGMGESSLYSLTFGVAFLDADGDGWQDAFVANGHIDDYIDRFEANVTYRQRPLFYRNLSGQRFAEVGLQSGAAFAEKLVARGCAVADFDGDGDPDLVVTENNGPVHLYRNDTAGQWLTVRLRGSRSNRDAVGARVELVQDGMRQSRYVRAGGLFLSQSEVALHFGLGGRPVRKVVVTWPDGRRQELPASAGATLEVREP